MAKILRWLFNAIAFAVVALSVGYLIYGIALGYL